MTIITLTIVTKNKKHERIIPEKTKTKQKTESDFTMPTVQGEWR